MTVEIEIRLLDGSDAADFRKIRLSALANFPALFGSQYSTEAARELVWFEERIARSAAFGAYIGLDIIGLMVLTIESGEKDRHKAYLSSVYVEQVHQRSGIAARLLAETVRFATGRVDQIMLSVLSTNASAINLYRKFGFTVYGVEPRALKDEQGYHDEILMVLVLQ